MANRTEDLIARRKAAVPRGVGIFAGEAIGGSLGGSFGTRAGGPIAIGATRRCPAPDRSGRSSGGV